MSQGLIASHSGTSEGLEQAIGFFRRATELEPNNADAWGALAMAHALSSFVAEPTDERAARARARNALERSLQIDPTNPYAAIAMAHSLPRRSHWLERDRLLTAALKRQPDSDGLKGTLSNFWASVGRVREAAEIQDALDFNKAPAPLPLYSRALVLWSANRLEEADRAIEQAYQLYPLHYAVWFSRFYLLLFNGRASQAIAMAEDAGKRPLGIPATNFDDILQVARALHDREPWRIQRVVDRQLDLAHTGCGLAENAVTFVAALGRLDTAFDILGAYYFARGFVVPEIRFPAQQRFRTRMADRFTAFLFMPPLAQLRRDPRFDRLAGELGLKEYWSRSGHPMDAHLR
jgi:Flp pilus assembly protein TadD